MPIIFFRASQTRFHHIHVTRKSLQESSQLTGQNWMGNKNSPKILGSSCAEGGI